jgi:hypothetical protein
LWASWLQRKRVEILVVREPYQAGGTRYSFRYIAPSLVVGEGTKLTKLLRGLEARVRIELTRKGFADLSLTTWVPRRLAERMWWRCGQVITPAR